MNHSDVAPPVNTHDLAAHAGITWRILDRWIHKGYVGGPHHLTGTGHRRIFTDDEIQHILLTARLVKLGLTPECAALAAAELLTYGFADLGEYVLLQARDGGS